MTSNERKKRGIELVKKTEEAQVILDLICESLEDSYNNTDCAFTTRRREMLESFNDWDEIKNQHQEFLTELLVCEL